MYTFAIVLSVSVVATLGLPQYIEPLEVEGNEDDAYQFAYAVASPEHGDYHGHQQSRDERGFTSGSYYLLGADGQWSQTIFADKGSGYQALYNQRPAGAPPPQVSEVSYQIFVHPGATAISAQGGGGAPAPPPAPVPLVPFGGIQQKSLVNTQLQNNQVSQAQVRQPLSRFNRETIVSESTTPQQVQPSLRFNRDINQMSTLANPSVGNPKHNSKVIVAKERTAKHAIPDLHVSPSMETNQVLVPVHVYRQPKSIFRQDISSLLRRFQPRPEISRN